MFIKRTKLYTMQEFFSSSQEFTNPTREIWSLACEQAPEWGYASEESCERKHLMTSASSTLDDERSTRLRTGPVRRWRYFCVLKRVQGTSLTTMQMASQIKQGLSQVTRCRV